MAPINLNVPNVSSLLEIAATEHTHRPSASVFCVKFVARFSDHFHSQFPVGIPFGATLIYRMGKARRTFHTVKLQC